MIRRMKRAAKIRPRENPRQLWRKFAQGRKPLTRAQRERLRRWRMEYSYAAR